MELRKYVIDEIILMTMLLDAYYTCEGMELDHELDSPNLLMQDIISEHLQRGEMKEV